MYFGAMGAGGAIASLLFGMVFIASAFADPLRRCPGWADTFLIDGVLCFPIAWAEFEDNEKAVTIFAAVASVLFAGYAVGFFTGHFSC